MLAADYEQPIELPQFRHSTGRDTLNTHETTEKQAPIVFREAGSTLNETDQNRPTATLENKGQTLLDDSIGDVERVLAKALEGATAAGRWDVVAQLARELEARRLASTPNVVPLAGRARK